MPFAKINLVYIEQGQFCILPFLDNLSLVVSFSCFFVWSLLCVWVLIVLRNCRHVNKHHSRPQSPRSFWFAPRIDPWRRPKESWALRTRMNQHHKQLMALSFRMWLHTVFRKSNILKFWKQVAFTIASHANVLRASSRVPPPRTWRVWRSLKKVSVGGYLHEFTIVPEGLGTCGWACEHFLMTRSLRYQLR